MCNLRIRRLAALIFLCVMPATAWADGWTSQKTAQTCTVTGGWTGCSTCVSGGHDGSFCYYSGTTQYHLRTLSYGLTNSDIPDNATITGFELVVGGYGTNATLANRQIVSGWTPDGGTNVRGWYDAVGWGTSNNTYTYGNSTYLWGGSWTENDIANNSNFGNIFYKYNTVSSQLWFDSARIRVYSTGGGGGSRRLFFSSIILNEFLRKIFAPIPLERTYRVANTGRPVPTRWVGPGQVVVTPVEGG